MSDSRQRILERLRNNRPNVVPAPSVYSKPLGWGREQCIAAFTERMQAVRGEVHRVPRTDWVAWITQQLPERGMHRVLVGNGEHGDALSAARSNLQLRRYAEPIEGWKSELFSDIDVAITGSRAGLAESGTLVLWPDADEPRLMSLVPPAHIALLDADRLYENFAAMLAAENWPSVGMPTNALLISGPSKTADIEQTLAYGIHGPKQLITLILE
ncbi:MAG: lactate utilization protein [Gammaproteobacteria bacterium]|nr:lactate utilization protein [Gammaproteobacteria bacterium]